jgi:signal transduction histidine kinase
MLRPLELASSAMERVADGDLSHRAPAGADAAGRMGSTFNRMADRVQGLVQGQRDLMAAVSHELRTPLTRMRLQVELMREEDAPPARVDALERDIRAVDELVEELLESARLDQGVLALNEQVFDAGDLFSEALGSVDLGSRPVEVQVPSGLSLEADRKRVLRVVTNLLSNVARYTPPETPTRLSVEAGEHDWVIVVADEGHGVPSAALDRLFDPFFRVESSRSRRTGGLGLGLMLCRQIAEAHGGRITAANRREGGLIVKVTLPMSSGKT